MKKKISVFLVLALVLQLCIPINPGHAKAADVPEGYTPIYTIDDLAAIDNDSSGKYILMNDIDMTEATAKGGSWDTGHGWTPLKQFEGELDGNGYHIIGMHIYGSVETERAGLFEAIYYGNVHELGMVDVSIDNVKVYTGSDYRKGIGAIAGSLGYGGNITNCFVSGSISLNCKSNCGGLVGYLNGGKIRNCYNAATVDGNGINGNVYDAGNVYSTYNIGQVTGYGIGPCDFENVYTLSGSAGNTDDKYGKTLTGAQMKSKGALTGFDFDSVWEIDPYCSYGYPQLKSNRQVRVTTISVDMPSDQLDYEVGDSLNINNATLKLVYSDKTSASILLTEDMLSGYDMSQAGEQTVIVTYGNLKTSFKITVTEVPAQSVLLDKNSISINKNETYQLNAVISPENCTDKTLKWKSENEDVATVSDGGLVKAIGAGDTRIIVTTANGKRDVCDVTVYVPAVSIQISQKEAALTLGDTLVLNAVMLPLESTDELKWRTSNANVATVENGKVTALTDGIAQITAYTDSGVSASCKVTVKSISVEGLKLTEQEVNMYKGNEHLLTAVLTPENATNKAIEWESSDEDIATVDDGLISAKEKGTAKITATSVDGKYKSVCKVNVGIASSMVRIYDQNQTIVKNLILNTGDSTILSTKLYPSNTTDTVSWKSSKEDIVEVFDGEVVAGMEEGTATITAYTQSGIEEKVQVQVKHGEQPTVTPAITVEPTETPVITLEPTKEPTEIPTAQPSESPEPTEIPTVQPSGNPEPTEIPTAQPSQNPELTEIPTAQPSQNPEPTTEIPTAQPSENPELTEIPTAQPSQNPEPTEIPTAQPSENPKPTEIPTAQPSQSLEPTKTPDQGSVSSGVSTTEPADLDEAEDDEPDVIEEPEIGKVSFKKAIKKGKKVTLQWKAVSKVAGYQIQYSYKKNMKSAKSFFTTKKSCIIKLKSKKTIYVRIRAYKGKGKKKEYGDWNKKRKLR